MSMQRWPPRPSALFPPQIPLLISSQRLCFKHWSDLGADPGTGAGTGMLCPASPGSEGTAGLPEPQPPRAGAHLTIRSCDGAPCRPCRPWGRQSRGPSGTAEEKGDNTKISHKTTPHVCPGPGGSWGPSPPQAIPRERGKRRDVSIPRGCGAHLGAHDPMGSPIKFGQAGAGRPRPMAAQRAPSNQAFNEI